MKRRPWIATLVLIALTALPGLAEEYGDGLQDQDQQWRMGFALGKGLVSDSNSEIFAIQGRLEFRKKSVYAAVRTSWVAQHCNSRPNPTELALLCGISHPLDMGRYRVELGIGIGKASMNSSSVIAFPWEFRFRGRTLGLTLFANQNRLHSFYGFCVSVDVPRLLVRSR